MFVNNTMAITATINENVEKNYYRKSHLIELYFLPPTDR